MPDSDFSFTHSPSLQIESVKQLPQSHLSVLQVDLVAQHHEGEVLWISRAGLNQELVSPAVQGLEGVGGGHIKHQHAAVGSSVEGHAQRLEPLLAGRVPDLGEDG